MANEYVCCVCGMKHPEDQIKHIRIKGRMRDICPECAASIKGFV